MENVPAAVALAAGSTISSTCASYEEGLQHDANTDSASDVTSDRSLSSKRGDVKRPVSVANCTPAVPNAPSWYKYSTRFELQRVRPVSEDPTPDDSIEALYSRIAPPVSLSKSSILSPLVLPLRPRQTDRVLDGIGSSFGLGFWHPSRHFTTRISETYENVSSAGISDSLPIGPSKARPQNEDVIPGQPSLGKQQSVRTRTPAQSSGSSKSSRQVAKPHTGKNSAQTSGSSGVTKSYRKQRQSRTIPGTTVSRYAPHLRGDRLACLDTKRYPNRHLSCRVYKFPSCHALLDHMKTCHFAELTPDLLSTLEDTLTRDIDAVPEAARNLYRRELWERCFRIRWPDVETAPHDVNPWQGNPLYPGYKPTGDDRTTAWSTISSVHDEDPAPSPALTSGAPQSQPTPQRTTRPVVAENQRQPHADLSSQNTNIHPNKPELIKVKVEGTFMLNRRESSDLMNHPAIQPLVQIIKQTRSHSSVVSHEVSVRCETQNAALQDSCTWTSQSMPHQGFDGHTASVAERPERLPDQPPVFAGLHVPPVNYNTGAASPSSAELPPNSTDVLQDRQALKAQGHGAEVTISSSSSAYQSRQSLDNSSVSHDDIPSTPPTVLSSPMGERYDFRPQSEHPEWLTGKFEGGNEFDDLFPLVTREPSASPTSSRRGSS